MFKLHLEGDTFLPVHSSELVTRAQWSLSISQQPRYWSSPWVLCLKIKYVLVLWVHCWGICCHTPTLANLSLHSLNLNPFLIMKLKFCNKFCYVILESFILCKGLKQLILLFLWHRGPCCVQAFYSMNALYQLENSPLAFISLDEDQPSSVKLKRSCFQKKTSSRKQFCVKINEQLVNGETLRKQETPLLRTAVCPISPTCRNPLSRSAALQVVGWGQARGDSCWQRQEGLVNTAHLGYSASLCPTALFWFLCHNRINLIFFTSP